MFPPDTTHTMSPDNMDFDESAAATEEAPAPSAITWFLSAKTLTALATSSSETSMERLTNLLTMGQI